MPRLDEPILGLLWDDTEADMATNKALYRDLKSKDADRAVSASERLGTVHNEGEPVVIPVVGNFAERQHFIENMWRRNPMHTEAVPWYNRLFSKHEPFYRESICEENLDEAVLEASGDVEKGTDEIVAAQAIISTNAVSVSERFIWDRDNLRLLSLKDPLQVDSHLPELPLQCEVVDSLLTNCLVEIDAGRFLTADLRLITRDDETGKFVSDDRLVRFNDGLFIEEFSGIVGGNKVVGRSGCATACLVIDLDTMKVTTIREAGSLLSLCGLSECAGSLVSSGCPGMWDPFSRLPPNPLNSAPALNARLHASVVQNHRISFFRDILSSKRQTLPVLTSSVIVLPRGRVSLSLQVSVTDGSHFFDVDEPIVINDPSVSGSCCSLSPASSESPEKAQFSSLAAQFNSEFHPEWREEDAAYEAVPSSEETSSPQSSSPLATLFASPGTAMIDADIGIFVSEGLWSCFKVRVPVRVLPLDSLSSTQIVRLPVPVQAADFKKWKVGVRKKVVHRG
jgi:hypothetical protein